MKWIVNETDWIATHRNHGNKIFIILRKRARSASQTRDINEWENEQKKKTEKTEWKSEQANTFGHSIRMMSFILLLMWYERFQNQGQRNIEETKEKKKADNQMSYTQITGRMEKKANRYDQIQLNEHHITTKIT